MQDSPLGQTPTGFTRIKTIRNLIRIGAACLLGIASIFTSAQAASFTVSLGELDAAIDEVEGSPDAIERMVLARIEQALIDADLQLSEGELLFTDYSENLIDDNSCTRTEVRTLNTTAALSSDTALNFSLTSINDPIELNVNILARVAASGRAKQTLGVRIGDCRKVAEDNFSFSASGEIVLSLQLRLELNPVLETSLQRLVLRPVVTLDGTLEARNIRVDVDDSLLRSALERILEDEIDDALVASELADGVVQLESDLKDALDKELEQGVLIVDLPSPTDEQVSRLYTLLSPNGDFSLPLGYLRVKRVELLGALVTGDDNALKALLADAATCTAAALLQTNLQHTPVYQLAGNGCEKVSDGQINDAPSALFTDNQCLTTLDFQSTSDIDYCRYVLDTERLGNAQSNPETLDQWTLSPGTRFDIGAVRLSGLLQPFTQRVNYKQVSTAQGECSLEMRIHTLAPGVEGGSLKPLIAFHGGSWSRRSSGALGIEAVSTLFANQGYVVFAPFYRLIDTDEGNAACNDATLTDVLDDASDALDWVQSNAARYGAEGRPVVFGQSAGGHMSAVLAVERAEEIASAVLFYAPTDFTDFARQILSGEIDSETGKGILESVVGQTLETLDINAPLIRRNTLTERIAGGDIDVPPFFLLHGMEDTVLPFEQSVRFCNSLTGSPDAGPASDSVAGSPNDPFKRVINCDLTGSELHLITEGEHALDLCISEELCLAGSPLSAQATANSVERMLDWVQLMDVEEIDTPVDENTPGDGQVPMQDGSGGGGGQQMSSGGATGVAGILLLFAVFVGRALNPWRLNRI